jgi:hypothetical protein
VGSRAQVSAQVSTCRMCSTAGMTVVQLTRHSAVTHDMVQLFQQQQLAPIWPGVVRK